MDYIACQAPLSMGFSRQEYWSGLPSFQPKDRTHVSCTGRWMLYHWATWEEPPFKDRPPKSYQIFCLHLVGYNLVTWPLPVNGFSWIVDIITPKPSFTECQWCQCPPSVLFHLSLGIDLWTVGIKSLFKWLWRSLWFPSGWKYFLHS